MFPVSVSNCLKAGLVLLWILAALFYISAGLECYDCSAAIPIAALHYYEYGFDSGEPPKQNVHCQSPRSTWHAYYPPSPKKTCSSTQPTCEKSTRVFNHTFLEINSGEWYSNVYSVLYGRFSSQPLPPKGQQCFNVSENVTRLGIDPKVQPNNVTFAGVMCLCDTDLCNDQPGVDDKDNDLSWVYVPTTPKVETTTTTKKYSNNIPMEMKMRQILFNIHFLQVPYFGLCYFL